LHIGLQIVGTFLFGGALLNFIIPTFMLLVQAYKEKSEANELYFGIGGKIHRKWFLLNNLIGFILLVSFTFLVYLLRNWVMLIICLPYFFIVFLLAWNNVYKRLNAITDNHKFSLWFTILFESFCIFSKYIYNNTTNAGSLICFLFTVIVWAALFFMPSKRIVINGEKNSLFKAKSVNENVSEFFYFAQMNIKKN